MYYAVIVMQGAGLDGRRGELIASAVQYTLNVVFTLPALWYIDRWGRRPMLLYGAIAMALWLMLVGALQGAYGHSVDVADSATASWRIEGHTNARNAIIVFSYFFVCSFAITWGPCSWTYASEIFPTRVRGKAVSFSTATNWAFNFALAYATPPAFRNIQYKTYFLYMAFNCAAAIHIFFMFPETKGRTLEEMEEVFNNGNAFAAWRLDSNVGKKTLADLEGTAATDSKPALDRAVTHHSQDEKEPVSPTTA
ncbi:hypothetical protein JCM6882_005188 [Rhodosporidiobolus microsporus]